MKQVLILASAIALLVMAGPASAQVILDFDETANGGSCTANSTSASCSGVPIANVTVENDGALDGTYAITGGSLSYAISTTSPATDSLTIAGAVPTLGTGVAASTLMSESGALSGLQIINEGGGLWKVEFNSTADSKGYDLVKALGLSTGTCSGTLSTSLCSGWATFGSNALSISSGHSLTTDITDVAVPEPTSMLLLGSLLVGTSMAIRRKSSKKA